MDNISKCHVESVEKTILTSSLFWVDRFSDLTKVPARLEWPQEKFFQTPKMT